MFKIQPRSVSGDQTKATVQAKALLREEIKGAKIPIFSQKEHLFVLRKSFLLQPTLLDISEAQGTVIKNSKSERLDVAFCGECSS